ncbi:hypothetical protein OROMI_031913 [Orobanche minor]
MGRYLESFFSNGFWNDAADEVLERHHQEKGTQQSAESKDVNLEQKKYRITRKRAKKLAAPVMDYDQTIITGHEYEYWPQDPSDLRRERKLKMILMPSC